MNARAKSRRVSREIRKEKKKFNHDNNCRVERVDLLRVSTTSHF